MPSPLSRRRVVTLGAAASIGVLAGCQSLTGSGNRDASTTTKQEDDGDGDTLGLVVSKSRTSFPGDEAAHSGWVHIVSDGQSADLTFDARFCHGLGDVEPELHHSIAGEYRLQFAVGADPDGKAVATSSPDGPACSSGVHLVGAADVADDWETLVVSVDGTDIRTVERTGTFPELRPLPDPIQFEE